MSPKSVTPSINELAFDCPHCGAYTSHKWFDLYADGRTREEGAPQLIDEKVVATVVNNKELDADTRERFVAHGKKVLQGLVVLEKHNTSLYAGYNVSNLHLSECFTCQKIAVWVHGRIVAPAVTHGPQHNSDLSDEIAADYKEAAQIVNLSPRGAAALLRLAIQKLCIELGEKGKSIDDDIASLVKKGLSPLVQQALDAVRVIGNEAVHPGALDLKDDVATTMKLFEVINIIAEQMISNPKHIKELYDKLPDVKRSAIERRDGKPI
jgi:hypothetical protein